MNNSNLSLEAKKKKCISRIWAFTKKQGISEEDLYLLINSLTGKDSMRLLNIFELCKVIEKLEGKKNKTWNRKVVYLPIDMQRRKISLLLSEMEKKKFVFNRNSFLESISKKITNKEYSMLNSSELSKVIEALKSISKRKEHANHK